MVLSLSVSCVVELTGEIYDLAKTVEIPACVEIPHSTNNDRRNEHFLSCIRR